MDHVVSGLSDGNAKVRLAAVRCLHSLSRSVQQLRTTFQDHTVWKPLMQVIHQYYNVFYFMLLIVFANFIQLLHGAHDDILVVASSTLCNLLLEFSPSKEPILESGAVDLLCSLTFRENPALRLNGIWALMVSTFIFMIQVVLFYMKISLFHLFRIWHFKPNRKSRVRF